MWGAYLRKNVLVTLFESMVNSKKPAKRRELTPVPHSWIPEEVEANLPKIKERSDKFDKEFDEKFPRSSSDRNSAEGLLWLIEAPHTLLLLGHNSAVIIELHGWLERFALTQLVKRIGKDEISREILKDLIKRKTLSEICDYFVTLGLWNKDDVSFIRKLKSLRDGIAHKNFDLLRKHLGDRKTTSEMTELIDKIDCTSYVLKTMELIMKIVIRRRPGNGKRKVQSKN